MLAPHGGSDHADVSPPHPAEKLKKGGYKANGKSFKNHIDGFNLLPFLTGKEAKSPREGECAAPGLRPS